FDAVAVMDAAVGLHGIVGAQAVLHNEEGLLVAVVEGVHGGAQALGVDGPAPVAGLEVGVLDAVKDGVALGALLGQQLPVGGHAAAGIVAEGAKVHRARLHVGLVLGGAVQMDAGLLHPLFGPDGVGAPGLGVDEEVVVPVRLQRRPDVVGAAGAGVELAGGQHAAHHGPRHHLVGQTHRFGAGHDLVVGGAVFDFGGVLALFKEDARAHEGQVQQHVDLVEGQPVFHLVLVAGKDGGAVFQVGVDHPAVFPAAVFLDQGDGGVKVADGDQRLDA